jgi:hypothetical protein
VVFYLIMRLRKHGSIAGNHGGGNGYFAVLSGMVGKQ